MRTYAYACALAVSAAAFESGPAAAEPAALTLIEGVEYVAAIALAPDGALYFSNPPANQILVIPTDAPFRRFTPESRGASGIAFGPGGALFACETDGRAVAKWTPDGSRTVIAERCDGKRFNGPKGLWIDAAGGVYITDPFYRPIEGREVEFTGVYYIPADDTPVRLATASLANPDAIAGARNGGPVYIATTGDGMIWAHDVEVSGVLSNPRIFAERPAHGLAVDGAGRVYAAVESAVEIFAAGGQLLRRIDFPSLLHGVAIAGNGDVYAAGPHAVFRSPAPFAE